MNISQTNVYWPISSDHGDHVSHVTRSRIESEKNRFDENISIEHRKLKLIYSSRNKINLENDISRSWQRTLRRSSDRKRKYVQISMFPLHDDIENLNSISFAFTHEEQLDEPWREKLREKLFAFYEATIENLSSEHRTTVKFWKDRSIVPIWDSWENSLVPLALSRDVDSHRSLPIIHKNTRMNGPVKFIRRLLKDWNLKGSNAVALLGFEASQSAQIERVLEGAETLRGRDVKDRIVHLYHIRKTLSALFEDLEVENDWLREPHSLLNDCIPMDLLLEGSLENLLLVRDYVETVAGQ